MHPIYEYMVGDTVANMVDAWNSKIFFVARQRFVIKECSQMYIGSKSTNQFGVWRNHYKGFVENLGNHLFNEDELCTCRMVLTEKNIFPN